jgi:chromosome segregation ATPase
MLPSFDSIAPTLDAVAPTELDQTLEASYRGVAPSFVTAMEGYVDAMLSKHNPQYHTQMSAIETQLTRYLAGGTGLNDSVENAIYERAKAKNNAEASRVQAGAWGDAAARGFTLPNGALMSAMQTARQAAADNNASAAREIVVMQAEMEQKNLQFAVTTSTGLRTALLNASLSYHQNLVSINGQALDYAKTTLNAVIETYNTAVKAYSAKLDGYKSDAQVFETKLRGAMAGIELYKAEIDALQALVTVDRAKVDIFRARIDSLASLANVYRAQIEAVQGRASLEKLKLDLFQSQVQSYTSLVQAKNAEWQGYSAAVNGQDAKVKIYSAQIDAYRGHISGYQAKISAQAEAVRATATTNQARADQYKATLSGYQTIAQTRGEVARTKVAIQGQLLDAFKAKVQAEVSNAQVKQAYYTATSDVAIANAASDLQAKIAEGKNRMLWGSTLAQTSTANAQIYAGLASAAMAGMNTLAAQTQAI